MMMDMDMLHVREELSLLAERVEKLEVGYTYTLDKALLISVFIIGVAAGLLIYPLAQLIYWIAELAVPVSSSLIV